jgi:hypothetical protein
VVISVVRLDIFWWVFGGWKMGRFFGYFWGWVRVGFRRSRFLRYAAE